MRTEEIIGKKITNIYSLVTMELGGLDTGECFLELDHQFIIDIPFGFDGDICLKALNKNAISLFNGYRKNKLNNLKDRTITDIIWYAEEMEMDKVLLLLDNGCVITETTIAPHGTGFAGLNYFENLEAVSERRGTGYLKFTDTGKTDNKGADTNVGGSILIYEALQMLLRIHWAATNPGKTYLIVLIQTIP